MKRGGKVFAVLIQAQTLPGTEPRQWTYHVLANKYDVAGKNARRAAKRDGLVRVSVVSVSTLCELDG